MTKEQFVEQLKEQAEQSGNYKNGIVTKTFSWQLKIKKCSDILDLFRKAFPNNFVQKEKNIYKVYAGDKEIMKMLHSPIKGISTPASDRRKMKKYIEEDIKSLKETYNIK